MGLFLKSPEEKAAREKERIEQKAETERKKIEKLRQLEEKAFAASPAGQARVAKASGSTIFQIDLPLSKTTAPWGASCGQSSKTEDYSTTIESIEKEGWRLDHAGYVYRITGSDSHEKAIGSGLREAVSGEIIGIYIFRAGAGGAGVRQTSGTDAVAIPPLPT